MSATRQLCIFLGLLAISGSVRIARAVTDEDRTKIYAAVLPFVGECTKEFGISDDEVKAAKSDGTVASLNPCFIACFLKKTEFMNAEGNVNPDKGVEFATTYLSGEDDKKKAEEVIRACSSVNEEAVTDGAKGCERSRLLLDCLLKHKAEFLLNR